MIQLPSQVCEKRNIHSTILNYLLLQYYETYVQHELVGIVPRQTCDLRQLLAGHVTVKQNDNS